MGEDDLCLLLYGLLTQDEVELTILQRRAEELYELGIDLHHRGMDSLTWWEGDLGLHTV